MKTKTKTAVDSFSVRSGKVTFGDPCYETNKSVKAQKGEWTAHVVFSDEGSWGRRVKRLVVHRDDFNPADRRIVVKTKTFGVDSGQAGVFDSAVYGEGTFYDDCCKATLGRTQWGYLVGGVVSSSGFGDGGYEAEVHLLGDEAVCVELVFIED
jgi:hypothetical protein